MTVSEQLKRAIRHSGLNLSQIAEATGVSHPILSRFLSEDPDAHRDIRLEKTADRLAAYFRMTLTEPRLPSGRPPRPKR